MLRIPLHCRKDCKERRLYSLPDGFYVNLLYGGKNALGQYERNTVIKLDLSQGKFVWASEYIDFSTSNRYQGFIKNTQYEVVPVFSFIADRNKPTLFSLAVHRFGCEIKHFELQDVKNCFDLAMTSDYTCLAAIVQNFNDNYELLVIDLE